MRGLREERCMGSVARCGEGEGSVGEGVKEGGEMCEECGKVRGSVSRGVG